jgi:predicted metal-dependent phosphoesterase TrpH
VKFADLHLHTIFSDSTYTPGQLVQEALASGLTAIAVVDHDTIDGIEPTLEISKERNLEVLSGVELSVEYENLEIHILGYLVDYHKEQLREKLNFLRQNRIERIHKIVTKLNALGVQLNASSVFEMAGCGTPGRLHVARALVKEGWVDSILDAFRKYIGDNSPAYVLGFRFTPLEAINLVRSVGGIPVLAHPYSLNRDDLIPYFVDQGLMGLEVYYPEHTASMVNTYLGIAKKYNLLVTGGSDCHGNAKPEVKIGSVKIPYKLVEKLKVAKQRL